MIETYVIHVLNDGWATFLKERLHLHKFGTVVALTLKTADGSFQIDDCLWRLSHEIVIL